MHLERIVKKIEITREMRFNSCGDLQIFYIESQMRLVETEILSKKEESIIFIRIGLIFGIFAFILMILIFTRHEDLIITVCTVFETIIAIISLK